MEALQMLMEESPHLVLSRLICPRHLDDNTTYHGCLVPAFDAGVKAGLGMALSEADFETLEPAWNGQETGITLPVYYTWSFTTGPDGDFESLARRLQPFPMPETVGVREIDVGHAGSGLPESDSDAPIYAGLKGALVSPIVASTTWVDPHRADFQTKLRRMLDLTASVQPDDEENDPIVGPPLYGRWHAAVEAVPADGAAPLWLGELNLDPPLRATAGLAADTVRANQEDLMQQAWEQIGSVLEANRKLRQAQLAREVSGSIKKRHFDTLPSDDMRVQIASPALSRVPLAGVTAGGELRASSVPDGTASGAMRRFTRPAGPVSKHSGTANADWAGRALTGLSADPDIGLSLGNDLLPPAGMGAIGHVIDANPPTGSGGTVSDLYTDYSTFADNYRQSSPPADMVAVREQVTQVLDPESAVLNRAKTRIQLPEAYWAWAEAHDPLGPVMAAPEFTRPMYETVPTQWLVPGLEVMPEDALGILEVNPAFIETYLVGLSHEMARELLWREYPTDQRGTYFRQFWDVRGKVPPPKTDDAIEAAKDIDPIHQWDGHEPLGDNLLMKGADDTRAGASPNPDIVVIIRGELLHRYPNTVVYMAQAAWDNNDRRVPLEGPDGEVHKFPIFTGQLDADIRFFGFDLSVPEAQGDGMPDPPDAPKPDAGWFVVFQEQPTEPQFGLDIGEAPFLSLTTWEDLSWGGFNGLFPKGEHLIIQDVSPRTIDDVTWGKNGAHMARITLQTPARVLYHADALLPPETSQS